MRHLDEGELHAYLDAADKAADVAQHLTECAECRARLEDVSRVRDRAAGILAAAAPQVSPPPFERVLVARAGRSVAAAKRSWSRQLAAAAVVALVVGVGWYATWRLSGTGGPEVAIAGSERAAGEPQAAGAVSPSGVAESARAFSTLAAPGESSVVADRQVAMAERAGGAPAPAEGAGRAGVMPGQAGAVREADEFRAAAKPVEEPGVAGRLNVDEKRVAEGAAPGAVAAAPGAAAGPVVEAPRGVPPAPPAQPAAAEPEFRPVRAPRAREAMVRPVADTGWVPTTEANAAARLGGPVAVVEGLNVTGVAVREEAGEVVVRVTQQLGGGREVELIQRALSGERRRAERERAEVVRPGAAPPRAADQAERAAPGAGAAARGGAAPAGVPTPAEVRATQERAAASVVWRGYEVTAKGPVPAESLQVLLARLRPR